MAFERVFDRQIMQAEFRLHGFQLGGLRIFQRHPNKATRLADKEMNLIDGDISEFFAVLVSDTVDEQPITLERGNAAEVSNARGPARYQSCLFGRYCDKVACPGADSRPHPAATFGRLPGKPAVHCRH